MYLTAIIDWFSRRIVGWELSDTLDTRSVLDAVRTATDNWGIPAILNSDQGRQFTGQHRPIKALRSASRAADMHLPCNDIWLGMQPKSELVITGSQNFFRVWS